MKKNIFILLLFLLPLLAAAIYYRLPFKKIPPGILVDQLLVKKSAHKMLAYSKGRLVQIYTIAIGRNPVGPKRFRDDGKTPEGSYIIFDKNPNSGWHKNLGISYPNQNDVAAIAGTGKSTGGDIKIHGLKNGGFNWGRFHRWKDWTNGCIALTNEEMDDLYMHTAIGTGIIIEP